MSEYRVLARKYRPQTFDDLVGQDVLVRTLSNAITTGRIAHAFLLTGIRGIGKTTTARIIARALNCIGEDGQGGPTTNPCGVCPNCTQIADDRHVDVMEMDAASRTGVGDIRDLIETVHYAPTNARYKIYIIDEVHMLSTSAFNALLKTLEEPPPHVIFIFATTEIRKIPVTILSRCQRFDLRRLDTEALAGHLANICAKENVQADEEGLRLMAMAAEGSVRDGLSLLDQAIAHSMGESEQIHVATDTVRDMLGLVDRTRIFALLEAICEGDTGKALDGLAQQHRDGADMSMLLQDMLTTTHSITRCHLAPDSDLGPAFSDAEKEYIKKLATKLSIAELTRLWQMLSKGLEEVRRAANSKMAADMVIIRLTHASSLPTPAELARKLKDTPAPAASTSPSGGGGSYAASASSGGGNGAHAVGSTSSSPAPAAARQPELMSAPQEHAAPSHLSLAASNPAVEIKCFEDILGWCEEQREAIMLHHLRNEARLVACEEGKLSLSKDCDFPPDIAKKLEALLHKATDQRWHVAYVDREGQPTVVEQEAARREAEIKEASDTPMVKAVLETFPGASIVEVRKQEDISTE